MSKPKVAEINDMGLVNKRVEDIKKDSGYMITRLSNSWESLKTAMGRDSSLATGLNHYLLGPMDRLTDQINSKGFWHKDTLFGNAPDFLGKLGSLPVDLSTSLGSMIGQQLHPAYMSLQTSLTESITGVAQQVQAAADWVTAWKNNLTSGKWWGQQAWNAMESLANGLDQTTAKSSGIAIQQNQNTAPMVSTRTAPPEQVASLSPNMAPTRSSQPLETLTQAVEGINAAVTALQSSDGEKQISGQLRMIGLDEAVIEAMQRQHMGNRGKFIEGKSFLTK